LAAEGVDLSVYFWIKTHENKPMEVFDRVATGIKQTLSKSNIEIYPPNPIVVQDAKVELTSETQNNKRDDL
jgi:hypothetical protein